MTTKKPKPQFAQPLKHDPDARFRSAKVAHPGDPEPAEPITTARNFDTHPVGFRLAEPIDLRVTCACCGNQKLEACAVCGN